MRQIIVVKLLTKIAGKPAYAVKSQSLYHTYNCDNPLSQYEGAFYVYDSKEKAEKVKQIIEASFELGLSYSEISSECARFNMITRRAA